MVKEASLKIEANYGRIPFDSFALDHWDFSASVEDDLDQWKALAASYMGLPCIDRRPYHVRAQKLKSQKNDRSNPRLTYENIERVLKTFQTIKERNASELSGTDEPIWVQSCYDADLDHRYSELAYWAGAGVDFGPVPNEMVMHDPSRYNFDDDVEKLRQQLLERMPGLCDRRRLHYRETDARAVRDDPDRMESKDMRMATYVLFADRVAIEGDFVKAMWLDDHGKILMITKMAPAEIESMATMFGEGFSMSEALETYGLSESSSVRRGSSEEDHDQGVGSKSKDYSIGFEAGYEAGREAAIAAVRDEYDDKGYADGLADRQHRQDKLP